MHHLSIVIPTWNEAPLIDDAVAQAARIADEVIVVDGGSADDTVAVARRAGARVITARKGRGPQLHAGALVATGEILLFLHADVRLPASAREAIAQRMARPEVVGGNFLIEFFPSSWFTRFLSPLNDLRCRIARRCYGDSGIFVRASAYHALGGFRDFPLMEDYDFSTRMQAYGPCAYIREVRAAASARRFQGRELRTLLLWMTIQLLYWLRISPHLLSRAYPDIRGDDPGSFIAAYRRHFQHCLPDRQQSLPGNR